MKHIDDTLLSAYMDNELDAKTSQDVANAIETDETVKARYDVLKASNEAAKQVFAEVDDLPQRDDLAQLINSADLSNKKEIPNNENNVVPLFGKRKSKNSNGKEQNTNPVRWAMAASVALCALFVYQLMPNESNIPYQHLTQQLNTELSGAIAEYENGRSEVIQSWETQDGTFCREIVWHTQQQSQPISACFENGSWQWQEIQSESGYQTASDDDYKKWEVLSEDEERIRLSKMSKL